MPLFEALHYQPWPCCIRISGKARPTSLKCLGMTKVSALVGENTWQL